MAAKGEAVIVETVEEQSHRVYTILLSIHGLERAAPHTITTAMVIQLQSDGHRRLSLIVVALVIFLLVFDSLRFDPINKGSNNKNQSIVMHAGSILYRDVILLCENFDKTGANHHP